MRTPCLPSTHYPDFFKLDLGLGTSSVSPLAAVIDEVFAQLTQEACRKTLGATPELFDESRQLEFLSRHGFKVQTLSASERARFYDAIDSIMEKRGTIESVAQLAAVYFESPDVSRGLPYERTSGGGVFRTQSDEKIVFVRLTAEPQEVRAAEFRFNAQLLVPAEYRVRTAAPLKSDTRPLPGISLKTLVRMERRKL